MNCWHCNSELIWGGDHDCDDNDEYLMVSNFSCPKCSSYVEVYLPSEKGQKIIGEKSSAPCGSVD